MKDSAGQPLLQREQGDVVKNDRCAYVSDCKIVVHELVIVSNADGDDHKEKSKRQVKREIL